MHKYTQVHTSTHKYAKYVKYAQARTSMHLYTLRPINKKLGRERLYIII